MYTYVSGQKDVYLQPISFTDNSDGMISITTMTIMTLMTDHLYQCLNKSKFSRIYKYVKTYMHPYILCI